MLGLCQREIEFSSRPLLVERHRASQDTVEDIGVVVKLLVDDEA